MHETCNQFIYFVFIRIAPLSATWCKCVCAFETHFNWKINTIFKHNFGHILQMNSISISIYIKFKILISKNIFVGWKNVNLKFL